MSRSSEIDARWVRSMRTLKSVVQAGGFSAAEKITHQTKAQISRQISSFEDFLGYKLCTRGPQGFELTERGKAILPRIYSALDALDDVSSLTMDELSGEVRIGIVDNVVTNPECHLAKAIRAFKKEAPNVNIVLQTIAGSRIVKGLVDGQYHTAIVGLCNEMHSLNYIYLFNEYQKPYYLKSAADTYMQLPFVINPAAQALELGTQQYLQGYEKGPEAYGLQSVAFLISSGEYVGMLPPHFVKQLSVAIDLECVPDVKEYTIPFYALTYSGRALPLCAERFIEILQEFHQPA